MIEISQEELKQAAANITDHTDCASHCCHTEQMESLIIAIHESKALEDECKAEIAIALPRLLLSPIRDKIMLLMALIEVSTARGIIIGYQAAVGQTLAKMEEENHGH